MLDSKAKHLPLLLIILDGWGIAPSWGGNAISLAKLPTFNDFWRNMPHTQLQASGEAVGLPRGVMGNSEVGHLNIGAGKIVKQFLPLIDEQIANREFFSNPVLTRSIQKVKDKHGTLHLMGIFSDGSVHGHIRHLFALLDLARLLEVEDVAVHAFTDGRDTDPTSALNYLNMFEKYVKLTKSPARIATVSGRFYAMDRDNRWERTQKAYNAIVYHQGRQFSSAKEAITQSYTDGVIDEFIEPSVINDHEKGFTSLKNEDSVICYNFRSDRMRQLVRAFCQVGVKMDLGKNPPKPDIVTFTEYQAGLPVSVAFQPDLVEKSFSTVVSEAGLNQFHIAETEKYAHITYFFNGGIESPVLMETRMVIPSPKVSTYDQAPKMSAEPITDELINKLVADKTDVYVINYANADMVGHTGDVQATVTAVETIDHCLSRLWSKVREKHGTMIITADHGNAEEKINPDNGMPYTEHTSNPVPFMIVSDELDLRKLKLAPGGGLSNVAPTVLQIIGLQKPSEMTADSLIESQ